MVGQKSLFHIIRGYCDLYWTLTFFPRSLFSPPMRWIGHPRISLRLCYKTTIAHFLNLTTNLIRSRLAMIQNFIHFHWNLPLNRSKAETIRVWWLVSVNIFSSSEASNTQVSMSPSVSVWRCRWMCREESWLTSSLIDGWIVWTMEIKVENQVSYLN